ncbi:MAG TPA: crotonase/enoyl-CoA hydratase family protein [Xanthobacteraceae bacterium]|nr:crotonase/enoyl-CoA hydratase family protein [Xanthobacteraceae bacterium]
MSEHVIVTDDGGIRTIRLNRPEKKNALTHAMYARLTEALAGAGGDDAIRCIVIAGTPGAFTAGNDLQDFLAIATSKEGMPRPVGDFLPALVTCRKPLVAAVSGIAVGIGTTMLFHCDHVVASREARFVTPFTSLGLVPEAASSLIAPRMMGHARAFALLVMGRPLDAAQARDAGLVNTVVAPEEVDGEAMKAAREIAALPPGAVAASRRLLRGAPDELMARIDEEAELFKVRLKSPEARAAFEAFLSKGR